MIAAGIGMPLSEEKARSICKTEAWGTDPSDLIRAAESLGFGAAKKMNLTFATIDPTQEYVIAFVDAALLRPEDYLTDGKEFRASHAVIIRTVKQNEVVFLDPKSKIAGPSFAPKEAFEMAWQGGSFGSAVVVKLRKSESQ